MQRTNPRAAVSTTTKIKKHEFRHFYTGDEGIANDEHPDSITSRSRILFFVASSLGVFNHTHEQFGRLCASRMTASGLATDPMYACRLSWVRQTLSAALMRGMSDSMTDFYHNADALVRFFAEVGIYDPLQSTAGVISLQPQVWAGLTSFQKLFFSTLNSCGAFANFDSASVRAAIVGVAASNNPAAGAVAVRERGGRRTTDVAPQPVRPSERSAS